MYICEEYIQRHNIDVAIAKHVSYGSIFYKNSDNTWILLKIRYQEQSNHPNNYTIDLLMPQYNGWSRGSYYRSATKSTIIHWDEYEKFFCEWAKNIKKENITKNKDESKIASWENHLYICDSLLAKNIIPLSEIYDTVSTSPVPERIFRINTILKKYQQTEVVQFWHDEARTYTDNFSPWLAEMVLTHGI